MINAEKRCYLCGAYGNLDIHHCIHGTCRRRLADEDGLTVYLCRRDHDRVHHDRMLDITFIQMAERYYIGHIGTEDDFRKRYGKSWL